MHPRTATKHERLDAGDVGTSAIDQPLLAWRENGQEQSVVFIRHGHRGRSWRLTTLVTPHRTTWPPILSPTLHAEMSSMPYTTKLTATSIVADAAIVYGAGYNCEGHLNGGPDDVFVIQSTGLLLWARTRQ
jgi:hypothetical protein